MIADGARLARTLGQPALSRILSRIAKRLAQDAATHTDPKGATQRIVIADPSDEELEALGSLLGKNFNARKRLVVVFQELENLLNRAEIAPSLLDAVTYLCGPLVHRPTLRASEAKAWNRLFAQAAGKDTRPAIKTWLEQIQQEGLLRRLCTDIRHAEELLATAMAIAALFPAPRLLVKELAATVTGDAHALDDSTALNTLVARLAMCWNREERPDGAAGRRELWRGIGLIGDELSPSVLIWGLQAEPGNLTGQVLHAFAGQGEPCRLTLQQLKKASPVILKPGKLFVCENPAIVQAAALRLKSGGHPLVCLEGQPNTAVTFLLDRLTRQGLELHYHGDFDWPGIGIANTVVRRFGAKPWRMAAPDYLNAPATLPLSGTPVIPEWDETLGEAMRRRGLAVHEEAVIPTLLADLKGV